MSIYKVTGDGVPGHSIGDEISEAEALTLKKSPYADRVTTFADSARARLNMRDATPSKPIGSVPADVPVRAYHPDLGVGALSENAPVAYGEAMHASPAIRQPYLNERLRDANPGYQLNPETTLAGRPMSAADEKGAEKLAPYDHEAKVASAQISAEEVAAKGPEGPSKDAPGNLVPSPALAATGAATAAPAAQERPAEAPKVV